MNSHTFFSDQGSNQTTKTPNHNKLGNNFYKLFWIINIIFSQLLFLVLISYVGNQNHILGEVGYQISLFLITNLLGITAFGLPIGWFYLSYYLFKKDKNISEVIRHLFWFQLSFFWFNVLLLNTNFINTSWAGLLPKFIHALVTRAFTEGKGTFHLLALSFEIVLWVTITLLLIKSYFQVPYKAIFNRFINFVKVRKIAKHNFSFKILKDRVLSLGNKNKISITMQTMKERCKTFWNDLFCIIDKVDDDQIKKYLGMNIPSLSTGKLTIVNLDRLNRTNHNPVSDNSSTNIDSLYPSPFSESTDVYSDEGKKDDREQQTEKDIGRDIIPLSHLTSFERSSGSYMTSGQRENPETDIIDLSIVNFFNQINGENNEGLSKFDETFSEEQLQSKSNTSRENLNDVEEVNEKLSKEDIQTSDSKDKEENALFDDQTEIVPSVINGKIHSRGKECLAEVNRLVFSANPLRSKTLDIEIKKTCKKLEKTIKEFGINTQVVDVSQGPVITQYELSLEPGVHINKIVNLADNLALSLAAESVRIVAPIPGKSVIGIEIPNKSREMVTLRDIVDKQMFRESNARLPIALGALVSGEPIITDLAVTPHLLVAGATGSGKSVCVNSIICSLLLRRTPEQVRFIMIDPKMVELNIYNGIPHLLAPVITDSQKASLTLKWAISEMEARYRLLERYGVRNIGSYNKMVEERDIEYGSLPYIVIIIDEFADLMMVARKEIEDSVSRLAAMSRAIGIHLLLATQRPSVDVITGVIKANFPSRIAFQVSSKIDSRTIIDTMGAEKLLGKGDMLYQNVATGNPSRIQGTFLSDVEVREIVDDLKDKGDTQYVLSLKENLSESSSNNSEWDDDTFKSAVELAKKEGKISTSLIQRRLRIGYNKAARIVELMEEKGIVGASDGVRPREVLVSNY